MRPAFGKSSRFHNSQAPANGLSEQM